jgi:hypothetical protein
MKGTEVGPMALSCECREPHAHTRIVLTGGPGAGKTAVPELVRQHFCEHVHVLHEAAGIVFGGGFPRATEGNVLRASQRAIFYVQRELEAAAAAVNPPIVLCWRCVTPPAGSTRWRLSSSHSKWFAVCASARAMPSAAPWGIPRVTRRQSSRPRRCSRRRSRQSTKPRDDQSRSSVR